MAFWSTTSLTDISLGLPTLGEIVAVLTFQAGFNSAVVLLGATLLGISAGMVGTFALLRNRALMADALAHSALPGLGAAFLLGIWLGIGGKHLGLLLSGAALFGVIGVVCVQLITRFTRIREDAAIGIVLSTFFGLGIVLMSLIQSLGTGDEGGLHHFIYGQTAAMNRADALLTLFTALGSGVICLLLFKEFRLVCFDQDFAASEGWPVSKVDLMMMGLVVIVTVIGLQAVGLLLIIALLVIPPAAARFWTERLNVMFFLSALIGGLSGYFGAATSALLPRMPAGAIIVMVAGVFFAISFLLAPARGILATLLRQFQLRLRVTEDHVLRALGERLELSHEPFKVATLQRLLQSWHGTFAVRLFIRWLRLKGIVHIQQSLSDKVVTLSTAGAAMAKAKLRNHRLWREYLVTYAGMTPTHVDYSADLVEHHISPSMLQTLEASLERKASLAKGAE